MSIDISNQNEERLKATARAEGISVDAYVEQLMNERDELSAIVNRAAARMSTLSPSEARVKIERGFLQSERGDVVDGETFSSALIVELDELEHKRQAG